MEDSLTKMIFREVKNKKEKGENEIGKDLK